MLGLGVKVHADTSELDLAESRLAKFGEHFEHHFWKHFSRTFGAGAMVAGIFKLVEGIVGKPEEIEKAAKHYGLLTDEVQMLQQLAKENGDTFEQMMDKVKKGAIDLAEEFAKLRKRGDLKIIKHDDIATITEDMGLLKTKWTSIQNTLIHGTAAALRGGDSLMDRWHRERAKERVRLGLPLGADAPWGPGGEKNVADGRNPETFFHSSVTADSPAVKRNRRMRELKAELEALQLQERGLRNLPQHELMKPQLSGWQQIGGFSSQQGSVVDKMDDVKSATEEVRDKVEEVKKAIEKLGEGY